MRRLKYPVHLTAEEKDRLLLVSESDNQPAQMVDRALILLRIDEGQTIAQVALALGVAERTVFRTKKWYASEGVDGVLRPRDPTRYFQIVKIDADAEARLIALACGRPPVGHDYWTLRLLASEIMRLGIIDSISHQAVRAKLNKNPELVDYRFWNRQEDRT